MQQGIRQQPKKQPNAAIKNPDMYAINPGVVLVLVVISDPQLGQIICVE